MNRETANYIMQRMSKYLDNSQMKFRRTMATTAIDKGMPIEQV